MRAGPEPNRVASIRQRLLDGARARNDEFQFVLDRYAVERLLYRLAQSRHRERFLLKGALLFSLWFEQPYRPTRDADFLALESLDAEALGDVVRELCAMTFDDGLAYLPETMRVAPIREEARYGGLRVSMVAMLGNARCSIQLDVGFGDAVTPGPVLGDYPVLLPDMPSPTLHTYPRETLFAEKLEAIAAFGMADSRLKDYNDLLVLVREGAMDRGTLVQAIIATFRRRGTSLPVEFAGLSDEFAADRDKQAQWKAFRTRSRLPHSALSDAVSELRSYVQGLELW